MSPEQAARTVVRVAEADGLLLESGRRFGPVDVAYETLGAYDPDAFGGKGNAILVCHALTGDSHVAGWWQGFVGPGLAIDTDRYFVICSNVLGGCQGTTGPGSTNPATGRPYGLRFPVVTPRDMVRVQRMLLERLGVRHPLAVVGGSLGGMQAIEWAVTYPDMVSGCIPIAADLQFHPQGIACNEVQRQAILNDPAFLGGDYYGTPGPVRGLATARMLGMITYRSDESMWMQFGRALRAPREHDFGVGFQVESYLHHQGDKLVRRFDANSYLYLSRAMDLHDVARGRGSLELACGRIRADVLVVAIRSDILFPPTQQLEMDRILRKAGVRSTLFEMDSAWGHDAFLVNLDLLAPPVSDFLDALAREDSARTE